MSSASFRRFNPNYKYPTAVSKKVEAPQLDIYGNFMDPEPVPVPGQYANGKRPLILYVSSALNDIFEGVLVDSRLRDEESTNDVELTDKELMLTPTVVFGFSLSDKLWCKSSLAALCAEANSACSGVRCREDLRRGMEQGRVYQSCSSNRPQGPLTVSR